MLEDYLRDEPQSRGRLWVEEVELDSARVFAELGLDVKLAAFRAS